MPAQQPKAMKAKTLTPAPPSRSPSSTTASLRRKAVPTPRQRITTKSQVTPPRLPVDRAASDDEQSMCGDEGLKCFTCNQFFGAIDKQCPMKKKAIKWRSWNRTATNRRKATGGECYPCYGYRRARWKGKAQAELLKAMEEDTTLEEKVMTARQAWMNGNSWTMVETAESSRSQITHKQGNFGEEFTEGPTTTMYIYPPGPRGLT